MSKPELKILIGLHRAANAIDRQTARLAAPFGLTLGQFAVLEALYHKGDLTVGQVQQAILSTSGTIPLIVAKLEQQGYVTRTQDEEDRRRWILHLTDEGRELIAEVYPLNEAMILRQMDCWSDEEKETLVTLLKRFGGNHGA
ncbi:MarR family winged helix-turn-helix transcriptional regulator [Acidaminobacterium chupaoyuni]